MLANGGELSEAGQLCQESSPTTKDPSCKFRLLRDTLKNKSINLKIKKEHHQTNHENKINKRGLIKIK